MRLCAWVLCGQYLKNLSILCNQTWHGVSSWARVLCEKIRLLCSRSEWTFGISMTVWLLNRCALCNQTWYNDASFEPSQTLPAEVLSRLPMFSMNQSGRQHQRTGIVLFTWMFVCCCCSLMMFMIGVNVWWVYLALQNIPSAIVLTLGNKVVLAQWIIVIWWNQAIACLGWYTVTITNYSYIASNI